MKLRAGFVSNSSAASFIVHWEAPDFNLDEITRILFEYSSGIAPDDVVANTEVQSDGSYLTSSWTYMMNSYTDFDPYIKDLIFALACEQTKYNRARLISCELRDE